MGFGEPRSAALGVSRSRGNLMSQRLRRLSCFSLSLLMTACSMPGPRVSEAVVAPELLETRDDSARQMAEAAEALLSTLSADQTSRARFSLDADRIRTSWSNLPAMFVERRGIRIGDLSDQQRRRLHGLMRASTSSQGYQKLAGIIRLDDILHEDAKGAVERKERRLPPELIESWNSANYWVAFFGDPSISKNWGWQLSGHHLAANFTVVDGRLSFTPLFLGAEPHEVRTGGEAGWRVLSHEAERGLELMQALHDDQRALAILGPTIPDDVFTGPGRKGSLGTLAGVPASRLNGSQRRLLWALIGEFVANVDGDAAGAQLARIRRDGLDSLHFAWIGPWDDVAGRYYFRVHGPSVLIEYVVEEAVGGKAANHVHSIVRDPKNDYGEDWLGRHYEEHHERIR